MPRHDQFFSAIRPKMEELVEELIARCLDIPQCRSVFEKHPDISAAVLSWLIGFIPEISKSQTFWKPIRDLAVNLAETIPRETVRVVKGQGTTRKGIGTQPKSEAGSVLRILDPKLIDKAAGFIAWFGKLIPEEQKKVRDYVLPLKLEDLRGFMELDEAQRGILLSFISSPPPTPSSPPAERTKNWLEELADSWENSQQKRGMLHGPEDNPATAPDTLEGNTSP